MGHVVTCLLSGQINHAVTVVGYAPGYWKVCICSTSHVQWMILVQIKNSWGKGYGEQGYIRIARGSDKCHVGDEASYPTMKGPSPPPPTPPAPTPPGPTPPSPPPTPQNCQAKPKGETCLDQNRYLMCPQAIVVTCGSLCCKQATATTIECDSC